MKKIVFLDRDGVIDRKPPKAHYVTTWEQLEILDGVIEALQLLTEKKYLIFIITNQAGIARGFMSESGLQTIHKKLLGHFKKNKISITHIYYCPHGWDEGCDCRKPKPGMLLRAAKEFNFDIKAAVFIGDDERDKDAGNAAGCKTILMESNGNLLHIVKCLIIAND